LGFLTCFPEDRWNRVDDGSNSNRLEESKGPLGFRDRKDKVHSENPDKPKADRVVGAAEEDPDKPKAGRLVGAAEKDPDKPKADRVVGAAEEDPEKLKADRVVGAADKTREYQVVASAEEDCDRAEEQ